ncbi:MAG: hypothetical protein K6B39_04940 [Lachnospiraceae bacterium]|nr:hypothetical protein [Lachnospiraceae bacterium]
MDIAATIKDAVSKITGDADLTKAFKSDPTATVKKVAGDKLPAEAVDKIVEGVKAKISLDKAGDALGAIKKLF